MSHEPCYEDVNLTKKELEDIVHKAKYWLVSNGGMLRDKKEPCLFYTMPFALFPTPIPRVLYEEVVSLQQDFNILVHKASMDHEFIMDALKSVIVHDEFTRRLYEIYQQVYTDGIKQKLFLLCVRSDYMVNEASSKKQQSIKQIELNTIAAGMGPLCRILSKMQSYVSDELGDKAPIKKSQIADPNGIDGLGYGMAKAFQLYGNENAVLLLISTVTERNRADQLMLLYTFQKAAKELGIPHQVPVLIRTLDEIYEHGELTEDNKFQIEGKEVAIFYLRYGYGPQDYPTENQWEARTKIEKSCAVKIPNVAEQLIGTKKVQQVFALPGVVEKYITDVDRARRIRATFADLYSLDPGVDGDEAARKALADPLHYVLKPQREGGGNNLYGDDIVKELNRISDPLERSQYILMERIRPPLQRNYMVERETVLPTLTDTVSEYGIFGVYLSDGENEIVNKAAGYLVRTKNINNNEGGVTCGESVINCPYLV